MKTASTPSTDYEYEVVEWIDGERVVLDEYEARLSNETLSRASRYLLQISDG
ncbi:MAG: hypothetical protein GX640_24515, partial [Fibrobacter sp.]|nr:hypothetical protein [Fibrobacter sp.]